MTSATSRKLTVFGALRLLLPSLPLLATGEPIGGSPIEEGKSDMTIGIVKFFNLDKGYGFIQPEDGGKDAFVHISAVEKAGLRSLDRDQRVSYDLETDSRGKTSAVNIQAA
jgi:CspA family cold shock protein